VAIVFIARVQRLAVPLYVCLCLCVHVTKNVLKIAMLFIFSLVFPIYLFIRQLSPYSGDLLLANWLQHSFYGSVFS